MLGLDIAAFSIMVIHDGIQILKDSHDYRSSLKQNNQTEQLHEVIQPTQDQTDNSEPIEEINFNSGSPTSLGGTPVVL